MSLSPRTGQLLAALIRRTSGRFSQFVIAVSVWEELALVSDGMEGEYGGERKVEGEGEMAARAQRSRARR